MWGIAPYEPGEHNEFPGGEPDCGSGFLAPREKHNCGWRVARGEIITFLMHQPLFKSFYIGGFECSTHITRSGRRLDMLAATRHDRFAALDYARLQQYGIRTAREGIRWHLVERTPYRYDFSSTLPLIRTARETGMQVIWDLMHFGYPDDVDLFKPSFVKRFVGYAREFMRVYKSETDETPFVTPINEISFLAFQGGEIGAVNPFTVGRGDEVKPQLVRATIQAIEAMRSIAPETRIVLTDPIFNAVADSNDRTEARRAQAYSYARYQNWDMIAGRLNPELGGAQQYLDILGMDYYPWNQWIYISDHESGRVLTRDDPRYVPPCQLFKEVYQRYHRPLLIAETSTENAERTEWLAYISEQARLALRAGVPLEGLCLYPIVNFPGWENDRHCYNGLWDYADDQGGREIYEPMAEELVRQTALVQAEQAALASHPAA